PVWYIAISRGRRERTIPCIGLREASRMAIHAPPIFVEGLLPEHWPEVARIYAAGIATGNATFPSPRTRQACTCTSASVSKSSAGASASATLPPPPPPSSPPRPPLTPSPP